MAIYERGLVIGRFQPFHKGHLYLFQTIRKKIRKVVIGIGSANVFDGDNPFTYEERKKMIETVIREEKLAGFIEKIVPLNDFYDDEKWFHEALNKTTTVDIIVGNNEWPNRIFESRGYKIWRVGFFKKYLYEGEKIRRLIRRKKNWHGRVPDYLIPIISKHFAGHEKIPYRFQHIALGGTFDHFHRGHQKLIDTALIYGKEISIGITTEKILMYKKFSELIKPFEERKKTLENYLKKKHVLDRTTFFPLTDIYGPTAYDGTIEAIIVSRITYPNAIRINKLREEKSLPQLKIICIKDVKDKDGELISSEKIRKLPRNLRVTLRKPLGKVIRGNETELAPTARKVIQLIKRTKPKKVIAVGDIIADSLEKSGFIPDVKIIDFRSRRQEIIKPKKTRKIIINMPGTISQEALQVIKESFVKNNKEIIINGEEDLLALPAILFAPVGSVVLYGQIDLGVVAVHVTEKTKKKVQLLIKKFK